jgi:hypothetical protein
MGPKSTASAAPGAASAMTIPNRMLHDFIVAPSPSVASVKMPV